ncbi:MAG: class I SAM-dependent methyltransferase [Vicinamibacterales bacterium]
MIQAHPSVAICESFGAIDIYLFDQLQKGRFDGRSRVLDAGCGDGRNLVHLLRCGFTCFAIDREVVAVDHVRSLASALAPTLPRENFRVGELDALPWADRTMDTLICSAVLHFSRDKAHFARVVTELWRVLAPDGLFFARLASTIGIEDRVTHSGNGYALLPDGSERFVVDEATLMQWTARLGGELLDPLKTTVVQEQRAMTTWVMRKGGAAR